MNLANGRLLIRSSEFLAAPPLLPKCVFLFFLTNRGLKIHIWVFVNLAIFKIVLSSATQFLRRIWYIFQFYYSLPVNFCIVTSLDAEISALFITFWKVLTTILISTASDICSTYHTSYSNFFCQEIAFLPFT